MEMFQQFFLKSANFNIKLGKSSVFQPLSTEMEANFFLSQKDTNQNHLYNKYKENKNKTLVTYRCVRKVSHHCMAVATLDPLNNVITKITHDHNHGSDLLKSTAKTTEKKFILAAAMVGNPSSKRVIEEIKSDLEKNNVESTSSMSKSRAIAQAILREKNKQRGSFPVVPEHQADIVAEMPDELKKTKGGGDFLQVIYFIIIITFLIKL